MILQMGQILHTVPKWRKAYKLRVLVFVEHQADAKEEDRRVSLLLENLRIDAELVVLTMDSGKLPTYEILVNGKRSTDEIDKALRNEPWWTERHDREAETMHMRHGSHHSQKRHSLTTQNLAIRKRRASSGIHPLSVPLSFRTNIPMPNHDDSTDSEDESDLHHLDSSIIMPRYTDSAVFDEDEESTMGMRRGSAQNQSLPDMDASPIPPGTKVVRAQRPINDVNVDGDDASSGGDGPGSPGGSPGYVAEEDEDDTLEQGQNGFGADVKPSISFAPPPLNHPNPTSLTKTSFNDIPAKAQHLIINELIKSNSHYTGVLFTTLPPPSAGTYKDESRAEDYLEGLAILCDRLPPCILIHSKSLTVTTAL